jgi:phosphatidylserine/phosphatidylglycerophosphate/cardiolipin synthase-like enzyme
MGMDSHQKEKLKAEIGAMVRVTFDDQHVSRSERQAIRQALADYADNPEVFAMFREAVFQVAYSAAADSEARDLIEWLDRALKLAKPPQLKQMEAKSYFSPGHTCRDAICRELALARRTIDICVFTVTDNDIVEAIERARRRGTKIRIITDNDKMYDRGSDIQQLVANGVDIRVDMTEDHMHHKFAIFDQKTVLTGSYNWTRGAARGNHENIVICDIPTVAKSFQQEFDELWDVMRPL